MYEYPNTVCNLELKLRRSNKMLQKLTDAKAKEFAYKEIEKIEKELEEEKMQANNGR